MLITFKKVFFGLWSAKKQTEQCHLLEDIWVTTKYNRLWAVPKLWCVTAWRDCIADCLSSMSTNFLTKNVFELIHFLRFAKCVWSFLWYSLSIVLILQFKVTWNSYIKPPWHLSVSEVVNELIEGLNKTSSLQSSWLNYAKPTTAILTATTRLYDRHALQQWLHFRNTLLVWIKTVDKGVKNSE